MDKQSNPCSLYLSLLPENEIKNVYISDSDEEGFRQYLTEQVQKFDDSSCAIPDIWLVQINFENRRKVERATSKIEGIIRSELEQQKGKIMHVISLMDAYYCYLKHINPLLEENKYANIVKTEGYFLLMISSKTQYMHEHSLMGIRTDRGVHVFSPDRKGMKAMNACLHYYEKHFFCREHATDRLEVIYIKAIGEMPAPCGNLFGENNNLETTPLHLPQNYFCHDKSLVEITTSKFDMHPTMQNYSIFCTKNGIDPMKTSTPNFEFLCLAQIRDGYSHHLASLFPEWPDNTHPYAVHPSRTTRPGICDPGAFFPGASRGETSGNDQFAYLPDRRLPAPQSRSGAHRRRIRRSRSQPGQPEQRTYRIPGHQAYSVTIVPGIDGLRGMRHQGDQTAAPQQLRSYGHPASPQSRQLLRPGSLRRSSRHRRRERYGRHFAAASEIVEESARTYADTAQTNEGHPLAEADCS